MIFCASGVNIFLIQQSSNSKDCTRHMQIVYLALQYQQGNDSPVYSKSFFIVQICAWSLFLHIAIDYKWPLIKKVLLFYKLVNQLAGTQRNEAIHHVINSFFHDRKNVSVQMALALLQTFFFNYNQGIDEGSSPAWRVKVQNQINSVPANVPMEEGLGFAGKDLHVGIAPHDARVLDSASNLSLVRFVTKLECVRKNITSHSITLDSTEVLLCNPLSSLPAEIQSDCTKMCTILADLGRCVETSGLNVLSALWCQTKLDANRENNSGTKVAQFGSKQRTE
jgi:hypothetical protein